IDKDNKRYLAKSFSIASDPASAVMELYIVKRSHMGTALEHTSHFVDAGIGDSYYVKGPYGQFRFIPSENRKVLFVAGGTGLAPFVSMLRQIDRLKSGNDVDLLYSVKYPTEIIRKEELGQLAKSINLKATITVTRPQPTDNWSGEKGHIDAEMIRRHSQDVAERACYICGPPAFVKAIKDALVSLGVKPERISADVWDAGSG
ncbi:MAG: FAD-dependent oxidoreductase, partial [Candidatus Micrarchaeota archaeon]|nr:FAD-dependent oxidoreductase [Candidatus Micrarchaeota archaeon]